MDQEVVLSPQSEPPGEDFSDDCFSSAPGPTAQAQIAPAIARSSIARNRGQRRSRFVTTLHGSAFRRRYFKGVKVQQWNDWHWQFGHRLRTGAELEKILALSDDERSAIEAHQGLLPIAITPYYASLLDPRDSNQALRRTMVPTQGEFVLSPGEKDDPLGEDGHSPVPGLVHRYPDRVLLLATDVCAAYCRYCTRSRLVGCTSQTTGHRSRLEQAIEYIAATPAIRDVLISGGDPLTLSDERLEWILTRLRDIPHVQFLRIGTKTPVVMPQRITPALVKLLRKFHPLWMSIHFTHPDEITPESAEACARLADAGIPLGSQTVLLKGINDDVETMRQLVHRLLCNRVRPYYLYQCDPITGSGHFRTTIDKGIEMIRGLRGHTSGYAVPTYVIDAPGGGGKIPILPDYLLGREGDEVLLQNFENRIFRYTDPAGTVGLGKTHSCPSE